MIIMPSITTNLNNSKWPLVKIESLPTYSLIRLRKLLTPSNTKKNSCHCRIGIPHFGRSPALFLWPKSSHKSTDARNTISTINEHQDFLRSDLDIFSRISPNSSSIPKLLPKLLWLRAPSGILSLIS